MYIKIAANSFRKYSFVQRSTFSNCYKVSQMTVFLYVTPYSLVKKRTKHLHLNDRMNVRIPFSSLVDLHTYQNTRRHLIKRRFFLTHREKLKFQFDFKSTLRRLDFRIKNSKIHIVHHTDFALAGSITRCQSPYVVYRRYCYYGYARYAYAVWAKCKF